SYANLKLNGTKNYQDLPNHPSFETWNKQFGLFWDKNGINKCKGRISNADIPGETKHPILLNAKNRLTELIVKESHNRVFHNGVEETLTELRSRFWIIRGRQFITKLMHRCVVCKKYEVNFAGPLYVKESKKSKTQTKTWIAFYTCALTRARHLELVSDMTGESLLLCFRRFCARRGLLKRMISDNAKTFVTASRRLKASFQFPEVRHHMEIKRIEWSFNTPKAPWQGGFFERLAMSVKRCLKKILGKACVTYEELLTILTEIECVLNSRPLTYVSTEDLDEPLTPSHHL
ncbi:Pro-Pol poly, partial [Paramuricea clavata]